MKQFTKQLLFIIIAGAVIIAGGLVIYSATPSGKIAIKPSKTAKLKVVNQENATTSSNNPVGWWKMDEGTGQYAYDVSGNGNTGTLGTSTNAEPADPTWTTGKLGRGLSFDGVNDYVNTSYTTPMGTDPYTFSAWVKIPNQNQSGFIFVKTSGTQYFWLIVAGSWNGLVGTNLYLVEGIVSPIRYVVKTGYADNTWHFMVAVRDAVSLRLYIDGVLAGQSTAAIQNLTNTGAFKLGSAAVATSFPGVIDDVRIYNRALSAGEVAQMWNSTKDGYLGKIKVSTGIILYFKLDEVSWATTTNTTPVKDYSGKGNNGTPFNHASMVAGQISKAGSFDGTDDYIGIAGNVGSTTRALSFWAKPNSTTQKLIELSASDYVSLSSGVVSVAGFGTPTIYVDGNATTSFANTNWHFITILSSVNMVANGVNLGKNGANYYNGLLDDIKLYNRTLTATEIEQSHQRGLMGKEQ